MHLLIKVNHFLIDKGLRSRPSALQLVLQLKLLQDSIQNFGLQEQLRRCEGCVVPCHYHFHDLSAREAVSVPSDLLDQLGGDALHANELLASVQRAWVPIDKLEFLPR